MSGAIAIRHWWSLALIRFAPSARKVSVERTLAVDQLLMVNLSSCPKRKTLVLMGYIELDLIGRSLPDDAWKLPNHPFPTYVCRDCNE